ncbi:MAG: DUF5343 domain-containing protein [Dehalococcoidales bacterium]|nr:DUF5343 domain-containing protein [Dehalococcoidales bacterium]
MTSERGHRHLPPYVSYRTFLNFIERLRQNLPSRIDRSYWGDIFSGSTGTQLMAAMRFLDLIDVNGKPTEQLKTLVGANTESRPRLLKNIVSQSYSFVMRSAIDLERATYAELEEAFTSNFQLTEDVKRKCLKFFIAMAMDAGLPVSSFILKHVRGIRSGTATKTAGRRSGERTKQNFQVPQKIVQVPDYQSWNSKLLDKFPTFDPSWSDDIKVKWFEAFDELLKRGMPGM